MDLKILPQKLFHQNYHLVENLFHFNNTHPQKEETYTYLNTPSSFTAKEQKPSIYTLNKILNELNSLPQTQLKSVNLDLSYADIPDQEAQQGGNGYNASLVEPEKILFVKSIRSYENQLIKICRAISVQENLESISFNISGWSAYPYHNLSDHHISLIMKMIINSKNFQKLRHLDLNFYKLGYKNKNISKKCLDKIFNKLLKLQNLESCKLNLSSFGIISDYETKKFYTHEHVLKLCQFIQQNPDLKTLSISARSWGYMNQQISPQSLLLVGETIGNLQNLIELDLDLHCWAYQNNFDHQGTSQFLNNLQKQKKLETLHLKLDYFNYMIQEQFVKIIDLILGNEKLRSIKISTLQSLLSSFVHLNPLQKRQEYRSKQQQLIKFLRNSKFLRELDIGDDIITPETKIENQYNIIKTHLKQIQKDLCQFPEVQNTKISKKFRREIVFEVCEYLLN